MRANSKDYPPKYIDLGLTKQVNYNISQREDELGDISYDYNYIIVKSFDYNEIIRELIKQKYSVEDEIAIINNNTLDSDLYGEEHSNYHDYRLECKNIAKGLIG
jgi:hypothetical protein